MPDPPCWEAGHEYGLRALANAQLTRPFECVIAADGPHVESVALSIHQLGLRTSVRFDRNAQSLVAAANIALFPRVRALPADLLDDALRSGCSVLSSDPVTVGTHPRFFHFTRRDTRQLVALLKQLVHDGGPVAAAVDREWQIR